MNPSNRPTDIMNINELTTGDGWRHKEIHEGGSKAVSEERDVTRIPAERSDIFLYPVKCCHLVQ